MRAVLLTGPLGGTEATTRYNVQQNESHSENKIFLKKFYMCSRCHRNCISRG